MTADLHTMTGAYALNALSAFESAAFERHLLDCAACSMEVRELRATAARLGAATAVEPTAELKAAVLAHIRGVRQSPPRVPAAEVAGTRKKRGTVLALLGAAAAAVAALSLGIDIGREEVPQVGIAQPQFDPAGMVLSAPDAATLRDPEDEGGTTVVLSRSQGKAVVLPANLPPLDGSRVYQVWLIGSAGPHSAGLLQPDVRQHMPPVVTDLPTGTDRVGITAEPAGGSPEPTTPAVTMISLS
ncbi:anti-sigma factor domain-containing protein [Amycolatopsis sp. 195334CR]|uniref:anti-sigma factor n=1 Tax=Amycolatopsis sp. 195334CR TaxID=2814588 RepID=UPI001A90A55A|nr:anti-sigma factor [Amycolatopsis sp. 195334CR]MBN6038511.1 anti-sigma factor [Amycolatopsis sp. 195334CR]